MNAAEMKRAAGRALELGLAAVLTVPVVLVILAAAAAVEWLWASRMLPQPVSPRPGGRSWMTGACW